ncbi:CLI_3235 family bacteriocin precursor [Halodesulfovibrio aestuarii]|uniref:CLI_3235 family bacteriocin n=1 Tax=Halodesulfovibrio aestuarii TaxID=126333 RepID=A0ABV4JNI8_9BACT
MKKLAKRNQKLTNTVSSYTSCYCSYCSCLGAGRYSMSYSVKRSGSVH